MKLVFDIETDGLIRQGLTKIHCIVAQDLDTGEVYKYEPDNYRDGLKLLAEAEELWGHNILGYDLEAIKVIHPEWTYEGQVYDTLILSRLLFTDLLDRDFRARPANMPSNLYGRHSLESWGHRLSIHKSEFGKSLDGDWSTYSPEMLAYCAQDVVVSVALVRMFQPKMDQYATPIKTEHEVAAIMAWQEREGFPFDVAKAQELELTLRTELKSLSYAMKDTFYWVPGKEMTPKRNNKVQGYFEGAPFCKLVEFNPTSRFHIGWAFQQFRGWEPTEFTDGGQPKIDESILKGIGTNEALTFARILELQKHLGQLSEGKNAWLKNVTPEGRLHHSCVLATNTGRMAHMRPNLAQVPSAHEYRDLFIPGPDRVIVGADASGLELRCLAHYLHRFDSGKFAKEVVEGDIHSHLAGIYGTDRKSGKGVTYCLIYGGGNSKLGLTAGASPKSAARKGKEIRGKIMSGLDGFKQLSDAVSERASTGVLRGLDGRPIRLQGKSHAALNYLLQSAGAVICKLWVLRANELLQEAGIDYWPLAFVHDEMQLSVAPDQVEDAKLLITAAMKDVEHQLNFKCQLDSEAASGSSWAETH
jgi:DNA polymerase I